MPLIHPVGLLGQLSAHKSLLQVLTDLSLLTNLRICLDAGDVLSYPGSGQGWLDRSGNGYDFNRGTNNTGEASDPTFNGTAGGLSDNEFFSFDGADYLTLGQANPAWLNTQHKDNAIGSVVVWFRLGSITGTQVLLGNVGGASQGFRVNVTSAGIFRISPRTSASPNITTMESASGAIVADQWRFGGAGWNEATGANGGDVRVNGTTASVTSTYSSPSASDAPDVLNIGAGGGGASAVTANSRIAALAMWSGTRLSATQLGNIYDATKGRFGIL